ncbi:hypothetical protein BDB01DRAFT_109157 [Pilobolus umbonatus]|nr:hypothetical protein BDB01DRAFT_109157 [Pilobolus umbonatus]
MDIEAAKNLDPSYDDASAMYGQVINLSKIIRTNITLNQVLQFKGWTMMRADYKRYYCLKLESLANDKGIPLYRCKDQWGADIVMAQTMKRESRIDSKETDGDVVDYRVDDRESSLDSCLVEHDYDNHNSSSVSSFVGEAGSSSTNPFYNQEYNDADMDPLYYHPFSSSNSNKRNRQ